MFRFTIRELVLLTLVVAMGIGWRIDHRVGADARDTDAEHYKRQWEDREKEWVDAHRWWEDAKEAWQRDRMLKRT